MATKREVERNEKIIRGLMKLPPNRRCINCNGLGPQYVCTNFWTFVCMICSGIHREFTHRVKSVSMSTFTSQEVEALQNGGNQRAREIYLKNWDLDRHRQPNSSNADKVREFIKAVYIDCQYAGGNSSEQPLQVMQIQRNVGDETRRASSYHSFSQSPPYDFQYEDRLNRKHTGSLTRKPGSDHKLYGKKATSFIYSPGRLSERHYEDKFANEGFSSRLSDYSFSSGDLLNSEPQSPNLYKDDGFTSPMSDSSREIIDGLHHQTPGTCSETFVKRDIEKAPVPLPQRTVSSGSIGSFEKNSAPLRSVDSGSLFDVYSEGNHSNVTLQNQTITVPSPSPSPAENYGGLNLFEDALAMPGPNSSFDVDLFQAQKTGSAASMDLFHKPADSSALSQTSPLTSLSYSISQNPSTSNPNQMLPEQSEPSNEAWATFDFPHPSPPGTKTLESCVTEPGGISLENFHPAAPSIAWSLWPEFKKSSFQSPPGLVSNQWNEGLQNVDVPANMSSSQIWKPFEDANALQHHCIDTRSVNLQVNASSNAELFSGFQTSEDSGVDGKNASTEGFSFPTLPSHVSSVKSSVEPMHPFMSDVVRQNSGNPFDVPFDSEFEAHNTLLDMSTLPIALPNMPLPSSCVGDVNDQWYHGNPGASGGMSYISKQTLSSQLENVPTHGPIASVGGNPFA